MPGKALTALALLCLLGSPVEAKIARSPAAVVQFKKAHPCPANGATKGPCPGWIVDHVIPLCAGGADSPDQMQWQTKADAAAKDKLEWAECRELRKAKKP